MKPRFCAVASQQAVEHLVGTASSYDTYVLIEYSKPWPRKAFTADDIPADLRQFIAVAKGQRSVQFLCIKQNNAAIAASNRLLIYEKADQDRSAEPKASFEQEGGRGFSRGYVGYEFKVDSLEQVIGYVEAHWNGQRKAANKIETQDLLVCTHGMRDVCCARFGKPFYLQAKHLAKLGQLPNMRLWQVSHIGGHRFAPTAISLPDGRYYGRLTIEALAAIVNRTGSIQQIQPVYRGWGVLPQPVQVLEQQLLLQYGWSWLECAVNYRIQENPIEESTLQVQLSVQLPGKQLGSKVVETYQAILKRDDSQPNYIQASCDAATPTTFIKYVINQCHSFTESRFENDPTPEINPFAAVE